MSFWRPCFQLGRNPYDICDKSGYASFSKTHFFWDTQDSLKLLCGFVKVVLCISHPLPSKTKQFDQCFKAYWLPSKYQFGLKPQCLVYVVPLAMFRNKSSFNPSNSQEKPLGLAYLYSCGQATWLNIFLLRI